MANRRCADWRSPTEKQARSEETARRMTAAGDVRTVGHDRASDPRNLHAQPAPAHGPGDPMPEAYWAAVLSEPVARSAPGVPIQSLRLADIRRPILRVGCRRCDRTLEIQTADAKRLYGENITWKDAGRRLLDDSCQQRTGSHEDDGCWPSYDTP